MRLLLRWAVVGASVWAAAWLIPGIRVEGGIPALLGVALILGIVNALVAPLVRRLACGLIVLTLGIFIVVINALMLLLAELLARWAGIGFSIATFWDALLGTLVISMVSWLLSLLLPERARRHRR